jgi:NADH:ubiquinone oxidoreductase subunit 6 (subunit J)
MLLSSNLLIFFFSVVLIFSSVMVIIASHSIFSLLFLVLSFIMSAFILFIFECEFLALIFIVIYVGAIAVLFLFAVMLLDAKLQNLSRNIFTKLPLGFLFSLLFLIPIFYQIGVELKISKFFFSDSNYINWYDVIDSIIQDLSSYGQRFYIPILCCNFCLLELILLGVLNWYSLLDKYLLNANQNTDQSGI